MNKKNLDALNSLTGLFGQTGTSPDNTKTPGHHDSVELAEGQTLCGELDIRIDQDGLWFYHGSPIGRKELVKLFASVLERDQAGRYWLITPAEKGEITVEDVPFQAVEMTVEGENEQQKLTFRTNVDDIVIADDAHPIRIETNPENGEPSPYVMVRDGLEARLTRSVFYQLVDLGVELGVEKAHGDDKYSATVYGVWSGGQFFQIGSITEQD
jgi:hypothetical protein|tara:strand:- start:840 stop:1475 length:636 start_codon:yes stop_codon:yes gene_type:complete